MANTLEEVFNEVYDLMGERATSTTYPILSVVSLINRYIDRICKWQVVSLLNPQQRYRAGNLKFLEKKIYYKNISAQSISVATTVWATELTLTTTDFPDEWAILINWEIATYGSKSATQLLEVEGITAIHPSGSRVNLVFALPDNINKPFQVYDTEWSEIEYQDFRYNEKFSYYTILTQDNVDYIYFNRGEWNNMLVQYYKKPTKLVYSTDDQKEIDLPDDAWLDVVAPLVAWDMKFSKWEELDLAQNNLLKWYNALQEFYDNYSKKAIKYWGWIKVPHPWDPTTFERRGFYNDTTDYV